MRIGVSSGRSLTIPRLRHPDIRAAGLLDSADEGRSSWLAAPISASRLVRAGDWRPRPVPPAGSTTGAVRRSAPGSAAARRPRRPERHLPAGPARPSMTSRIGCPSHFFAVWCFSPARRSIGGRAPSDDAHVRHGPGSGSAPGSEETPDRLTRCNSPRPSSFMMPTRFPGCAPTSTPARLSPSIRNRTAFTPTGNVSA